MYKAAALAIAGAAVNEELVPNNPINPKVHIAVAHSVAKAAMESGAARRILDDDYFESTKIEEPT